jgi:hypothetical protein
MLIHFFAAKYGSEMVELSLVICDYIDISFCLFFNISKGLKKL